ncbi:Ceramidase [Ascosphaera apis ARSEF 7405]|uniref:Ceramidase n=1 Tax=Ascosphaera apis ARSEF 7405 TaxID=392613 RepID=A0A168D1W8_9EURO|nr:Ceramidase [Ascosphaera apis ARSEF 7405]
MTLYYHYLQDPRFHECMYGVLTALLVFRSMWVMEYALRPSLREQASRRGNAKVSDEKQRRDDRDLKILRSMWTMVGVGLTSFLGGFLFWNIDNHLCGTLRRWRHAVGLPWGLFLEGHGYWHIMTGIGAYMYIVWGIWLRHCLNGRQDEYEFIWPNIFTLPYIIRRKPGTAQGPGERQQSTKKDMH